MAKINAGIHSTTVSVLAVMGSVYRVLPVYGTGLPAPVSPFCVSHGFLFEGELCNVQVSSALETLVSLLCIFPTSNP